MADLLTWLNPLNVLDWISGKPWLMVVVGVILVGLAAWQILRGSLATRRFVINVAGIGLVVWGTMWFTDWVRPSLTSEQLFTPPVIGLQPVKAVFVTRKTIVRKATYSGTVHPFERVVVQARSNGFVETVNVYPGDRVEPGQVLAKLESTELAPRLDHAVAEQTYLRAELKRDEMLFRRKGISASALDLSRSKERIAAAKVRLLRITIGFATIEARSDGQVSERYVDPGQYVQKGTPILAYDRLKRVRIRFDVAEQDLAMIEPGASVILELPQIPRARLVGSSWQGQVLDDYGSPAIRTRVTAVFPKLDAQSRLGVVEVLLPNPDGILRSNTYVIGHLITGRVENALAVPLRALTPMPEGKTVVFLAPAFADQGEVEMREVKVGLRNGVEAEIVEGLDENTFVVVSGNRGLTAGESVMVVERKGGLM